MKCADLVRLIVAAALLLLVACGSSTADEPYPPLGGRYREPSGAILAFQGDGVLLGPGGRGSFTVDGRDVRMTLSDGRVLEGERESADILVIDTKGETPDDMRLYREGSAAAQTSEARKPTP